MQRYLEVVCEDEDELPIQPVPAKGKNQMSITGFTVITPPYSQSVRTCSPTRSAPVKRPMKRPVRRPPKAKKPRIEFDFDHAVSEEYQQSVNVEAKYNEACFYAYCGKRQATESTQSVPKKHRGTYTAEKRLEVREYIAASGVSVCQASKAFNIPKSTIQDIKSSQGVTPAKGKAHKKGAGRPVSYSPEKEQQIVGWILEMRDVNLPVSIQEVKEKAREVVSKENPNFKASNGWVQKFFKRNNFTLRAKTSLSQYLPKDLEEG